MGVKPVLKGTVSFRSGDGRVVVADVSLWFVRSDKARAPVFNGSVTFKRSVKAGEKLYVSLFDNECCVSEARRVPKPNDSIE